jgi:hypothetical protein
LVLCAQSDLQAVAAEQLPIQAREAIERHMRVLETETAQPRPQKKKVASALKRLKSTLDGVAGFLSDATSIVKPLKRIAQLVGVVSSTLGLI